MSIQAKDLRKGVGFVENGWFYEVQEVKHMSNAVIITVDELCRAVLGSGWPFCEHPHRTTRHYSPHHVIRQTVREVNKYTLANVNKDLADNAVYLDLIQTDGGVREFCVSQPQKLVNHLRSLEDSDMKGQINITITKDYLDTLHRNEPPVDIERITHLDGFDFDHLYDHHHGHHHQGH